MRRKASSVAERFDRIAAASPQKAAIRSASATLTYADVQEKSNRMAAGLVALGVTHGARVGVFLERSLDLPVTLLAILKAGGIFVPYDPNYPGPRLEMMMQASRLALLITEDRLAGRLAGHLTDNITQSKISSVGIDGIIKAAEGMHSTMPQVGPDDAAYIMFTSGSTGLPKGVVVPHRGILRLVIDPNYVDLGPDEVIPQLAPIAFDASTFEIWGSLLNGGTLVMMPPGVPSIGDIGRAIRSFDVTTAFFTTGLFHVIVDEHPEILAPLRQVLAGGDALSATHVKRLAGAAPNTRIINGYGPTEATTFAVCYAVSDLDALSDPVQIGYAIDETELFVLDSSMHPVADGDEGELFIGGSGVALGYLDNAQATEERFLPNPVAGHAAGTLYRTGDLVRRRPDGSLAFLGRLDNQVKIRGFRVELGEIEARLREHFLVRDAIVAVRTDPDRPTEKALAACIILESWIDSWADTLRKYLADVLPLYMVPGSWHFLESYPLGPTGKVDRTALAGMVLTSGPEGDAGPAAITDAVTEMEQWVCRFCLDLLPVPVISAIENFFHQGGDSLRAARLAARLEAATGVRIPLHLILSASTLREIAGEVDGRRAEAATSENDDDSDVSAGDPDRTEFPLSFGQEQLWILHRADPFQFAYNEPIAITIPHAPAPEVIRRALTQLAERHAIFRTTYGMRDGVPCQRIRPDVDVPLVVATGTRSDFDRAALQQVSMPFDIEDGGVARALYMQFDDGAGKLLLVIHHIAFDGMSLFQTLLPEFQMLCQAMAAGTAFKPAPLDMRYADYALWQREKYSIERLAPALQYWDEVLDGFIPLDLPFRTNHASFGQSGSFRFDLPKPLVDRVRALARAENLSVFAIAAAALQAVLSRYTAQDDIAVGFVHDARPSMFLDGVVGGFVNTLVLRTRFAPEESARAFLHRVWSGLCAAQANDMAPFEMVAARAGKKLQLRGRPLLNVMVSYDPPIPALSDGWTASHFEIEKTAAKFELCLELGDAHDGTIYGRLEFQSDRFTQAIVERLHTHFCIFLEEITHDPGQPLNRVPILTREEIAQLTVAMQPAGLSSRPHDVLPDILASAAARHPQRDALVFDTRRITYQALVESAGQMAVTLAGMGIGPEKPAVLFFQDPLQRCIAAWSAWGAGAAVVSLDPEYPDERIARCIADIGKVAVLTETALLERIQAMQAGEVYVLQDLKPGVASAPPAETSHGITPDAIAYIIFTSGSTGRPKGVLISHRNACSMVQAHIEALGPDHELRVLQTAGPGFDAYISELLFTAANAGTLILAERKSLLPGPELAELIGREKVNDAFFTPSLLAYLSPSQFPTLRTITCAGEACPPDLATPWIKAGVRFIHAYGPAECTVCTTLAVITEPRSDFLPLGDPLPGYRVYLLDPHGNVVPVGVIGEICIAGAGVGAGYLNRPDQTEARFVPDPFSDHPSARMYRTGDLARYTEQGELEFIGRNDLQVKIRGMRVELGEIESILLDHPGIVASAVIPFSQDAESSAGMSLGAYLVFRQEQAAEWRTELTAWLRTRLPAHMVPSRFVQLDSLPIGANGKVERNALPAFTASDAGTEVRRPASTVMSSDELIIFGIWQESFPNIDRDPSVDFFEAGGHSLLAVKLLSRFNAHFDVQLPMRELFARPTISGMAAWLRKTGKIESAYDPLTDAQMDIEFKPSSGHAAGLISRNDILLTGAGGFLGRHLLWQLLDSTDANIYCLLRGGTASVLLEKQVAAVKGTGPWSSGWTDRLRILPGDLAADNLGLRNADRRTIVNDVDAIYHCGATVNSLFPYAAMRAANVEGTRNLLELAATGRVKKFNHVSTIGIFDGAQRERTGPIGEDEMPNSPPPAESGYACSKWVSEMLVCRAAAQGLPANIFRVGRAGWSNRTGQWNANDFMQRLLTGCMQIGAAPELDLAIRMMAVDFAAEAMVAIAGSRHKGETFHLIGQATLAWNDGIIAMGQHGRQLVRLSYRDWWQRLAALHSGGIETVLSTLTERMHPDVLDLNSRNLPMVCSTRTNDALTELGLAEPQLDIRDFLRTIAAC